MGSHILLFLWMRTLAFADLVHLFSHFVFSFASGLFPGRNAFMFLLHHLDVFLWSPWVSFPEWAPLSKAFLSRSDSPRASAHAFTRPCAAVKSSLSGVGVPVHPAVRGAGGWQGEAGLGKSPQGAARTRTGPLRRPEACCVRVLPRSGTPSADSLPSAGSTEAVT